MSNSVSCLEPEAWLRQPWTPEPNCRTQPIRSWQHELNVRAVHAFEALEHALAKYPPTEKGRTGTFS